MKNRIGRKPGRGSGVKSFFNLSEWGARQPWRAGEPVTLRVVVQEARSRKSGGPGRSKQRKAA